MRRWIGGAMGTVCLLFAGIALAGDPAIVGPDRAEPYKLVRLKADGLPEKAGVLWDVMPLGKADLATGSGKGSLEFVAPPGAYTVELLVITTGADGSPSLNRIPKAVTIGVPPEPGPTPPGPTPPGPTPTPPEPDVKPLIPGDGFRVLVVYETGKVQSLPKEQSSVLFARSVRDYLDQKCVAGRDGVTREWRIWDQDVDTLNETASWQAAMKRDRKSIPWIVISTGKTGYEGPLPANVTDMLKLLKKYGGE